LKAVRDGSNGNTRLVWWCGFEAARDMVMRLNEPVSDSVEARDSFDVDPSISLV